MEPTHAPSHIQKELLSLTHILHLMHHRNRNQHRLSKWYKSLSTFRRQISKLLAEVQELDTALAFSSTVKKKRKGGVELESKYVREAREKVETRVEFWERWEVERWFVAFSNLTADNQYATLGLMLLGCLARVKSVIKPFSKSENLTGVEEEKEDAVDTVSSGGAGDDIGEVVKRVDVVERNEQLSEATRLQEGGQKEAIEVRENPTKKKRRTDIAPDETSNQKPEDSMKIKRPKKKRKQGDAFDDLFSKLL